MSCIALFFVEIYSATRNSWEIIRHNPTDIPYAYDIDLCLHGFLLATGKKDMMAFDLHKDALGQEMSCAVRESTSPAGSRALAGLVRFG